MLRYVKIQKGARIGNGFGLIEVPVERYRVSMTRALNETENFAETVGISWEDMLCLRLLAEELLGMVYGVLEVRKGSFWIEREGERFEIHVSATPVSVGEEAKKRLMSVSTTGQNVLYQGVTGKLRMVLNWLSVGASDVSLTPNDIEMGLVPGMLDSSAAMWSLEQYRAEIAREQRAQDWDELERSVLSRLADDIRVGVGKEEILLTVYKTFK